MRAARIVSVPLVAALLAPAAAFAAGPSKPTPKPAAAPAPAARVYVVRAGDNLETIAKRNGTTVSALASANRIINPNLVIIGTKLKIPAPSNSKLPTRLLAHPERLSLTPRFDYWARVYGVPADLLKGLAWYESGWQNQVVSKTGAVGIGQLEPFTSDFVANQLLKNPALDPKKVDDNIRMSARFLRFLLDRVGGAPGLALAAYYQGLKMTQAGKFYDDTKTYVAGVSSTRQQFK